MGESRLHEPDDPLLKDVGAPPLLHFALEARAIPELMSYINLLPWLARGARGDGHPVLVFPGFLAGDLSTRPLRAFLRRRGWVASPWKQGANLGSNDEIEARMRHRIEYLCHRYRMRVSLIGWSLGGFYARELGREMPDRVRQVITLGTPFRGPLRANHAHWLFERLSGQSVEENSRELFERMQKPLQVPTTSIFSETDGIVAWQSCVEHDPRPEAENIVVRGSHCGLGHNPLALLAIADRLQQPEHNWQPFYRHGVRQWLYPDFARVMTRLREAEANVEARLARRLRAKLFERLLSRLPAQP